MACLGPCLPHCSSGRAAKVYAVASVLYLLATLCVGTPLADSYTPAQRALRRESARVRGCVFAACVVAAAVVVR